MIEMMRAWRHVAKDLRTLKRQGAMSSQNIHMDEIRRGTRKA